MEAYSTKVRELVLDAYAEGMPTADVAARFKVSPSWARRVKQRLRELGVRTAFQQRKRGPDPTLDADDRRQLAKLVRQTPDATLAELKEQLGLPVSVTTVWRVVTELRLTLKKSPCMPASSTART
jgi:transposase